MHMSVLVEQVQIHMTNYKNHIPNIDEDLIYIMNQSMNLLYKFSKTQKCIYK